MKKLFLFATFFIALFACEKKETDDPTDYRDHLVGKYQGALLYERSWMDVQTWIQYDSSATFLLSMSISILNDSSIIMHSEYNGGKEDFEMKVGVGDTSIVLDVPSPSHGSRKTLIYNSDSLWFKYEKSNGKFDYVENTLEVKKMP